MAKDKKEEISETTTIRIQKELKKNLDRIKGDEITYNKFIEHLLKVFLGEE